MADIFCAHSPRFNPQRSDRVTGGSVIVFSLSEGIKKICYQAIIVFRVTATAPHITCNDEPDTMPHRRRFVLYALFKIFPAALLVNAAAPRRRSRITTSSPSSLRKSLMGPNAFCVRNRQTRPSADFIDGGEIALSSLRAADVAGCREQSPF